MSTNGARRAPRGWALALFLLGSSLLVPPLGCTRGGGSQGLRLVAIEWGRRVRVVDAQGEEVRADYVVGVDIATTPLQYRLTINPATQVETLQILADRGTPRFASLFDRLDDNRGFVAPMGSSSPGPFTEVPRNAALRLVFDRALDPTSVDSSSVGLSAGRQPSVAVEFVHAIDRVEPHVLVVDPVISRFESQRTGAAINALGFPEAAADQIPNVELRFPTKIDPQGNALSILRARGGGGLKRDRDPFDPTRERDVVRVFRSGRRTDPANGFLPETGAPQWIGNQPLTLTQVSGDQVAFEHVVALCETPPDVGDVLEQGTRLGEVVAVIDGTPPDFVVRVVRVDGGNDPFSTVLPAFLRSPYDEGSDRPECFVQLTPGAGLPPAAGLSPGVTFTVEFSEPMDPLRVGAFDALRLTTTPDPQAAIFDEYVVGDVAPSADLRRFTFVARGGGIRHVQGSAETVYLHLIGEPADPRALADLAGNAPRFGTVTVPFALDPQAASVATRGFALRFADPDEDGDGLPDHAGQLVPELVTLPGAGAVPSGRLTGREMRRFSHGIDPSVPVVGIMQPLQLPAGIQTPLSPYGSRSMSVWRYVDVGFPYPDPNLYNLDVEGLSFAPVLPVVHDAFRRVQLRLSHALYLPDEYLDVQGSQLPVYPNSGLARHAFSANVLAPSSAPAQVVFDGPYEIDPADVFRAPGGTIDLLPWPAFRDAFGDRVTFTWRDTNVDALGGPAGDGADPRVLSLVFGTRTRYVGPAQVPTIGLPLLMDFKVWPAEPGDDTLGLNGFQTAIAATTSARPTFRVHSTGGVNSQGQVVRVDPDDEVPRGGFVSAPPGTPGAPTRPDDNVFHFGQIDFVVRVSRHVTRWFHAGTPGASGFPVWHPPVIEPRISQQPIGTSLIVEYRGAATVTASSLASSNAGCVDLYGRVVSTILNPSCTGIPGLVTNATPWTSDLTTLSGSPWIQIRFTVVANLANGALPSLDSAGIAFDLGT